VLARPSSFRNQHPTPLDAIATAPATKQMTVPSAHTAATVESLSILMTPTLAPPYPDGTSATLWRLLILVRLGQEKLIVNGQSDCSDGERRFFFAPVLIKQLLGGAGLCYLSSPVVIINGLRRS
jgi:hypothetical protein